MAVLSVNGINKSFGEEYEKHSFAWQKDNCG